LAAWSIRSATTGKSAVRSRRKPLGKLLYGIRPSDPATLLGVTAVIGSVAWLAAYVTARRATRVDPASVLRGE
jgi:putative ABC transport system permease protein